jgi:NADH dehydrogenase (ubiquinone) flavoprotein 2
MMQFIRRAVGRRAFSHALSTHQNTAYNNPDTPFDFTEENYGQIKRVMAKYPGNYKRSAVIPLLYIAQKQNSNWVPLSAMNKIAKILDMSEIDVYEVASFYTMFNRTPVGKYHLQVCGTTPCMVRGVSFT